LHPRCPGFLFFSALCLSITLGILSCASPPVPAPEALPEEFFPGEPERVPPATLPKELPHGESERGPRETGPALEPPGESAGLLLAFDDNFTGVWETYFDLLDRYGARVTFFIQGDYDPFCAAAELRGHEIGYHTRNHYNLLKVSSRVFFEETSGGAEALRRHGLKLRAFAYPYGYSEPWMDEALGKYFSVLRGFGAAEHIYNVDTIKAGIVVSKSIDNIRYRSDAEFKADIADMLGRVKSGGGILPLTTHTIAEDTDWGIGADRLEYLLKTAADLGLRFYRYGDFFED
jgi:peptidoglycan/xylan/chitin deacetylase (PgdA/CDA1 family)